MSEGVNQQETPPLTDKQFERTAAWIWTPIELTDYLVVDWLGWEWSVGPTASDPGGSRAAPA